jgi:light-regulated signal transduction histidine kinase (bacteriophytochrome)
MGQLIDDLLAFSRMGRQDMPKTRIDMQSMVNEIIHELNPDGKRDGFEWAVQALPPAKGDINTIRQVWINLLSNAIKYSGKKEAPRIEIGSFVHEEQTAFFIRDNGIGFDNRYRDKLFKVFQRLHSPSQFEGTGVGLALVAKIISKHGGKVWAEGEVNKGACFYFSLPNEITQ